MKRQGEKRKQRRLTGTKTEANLSLEGDGFKDSFVQEIDGVEASVGNGSGCFRLICGIADISVFCLIDDGLAVE